MTASRPRIMLITGASSGIGAATARAAVRAGIHVALLARRKESLEALVAELGADRALALQCDASDFDQQATAVAATVAHFGCIDIAFANAGSGVSTPAPSTAIRRNGGVSSKSTSWAFSGRRSSCCRISVPKMGIFW